MGVGVGRAGTPESSPESVNCSPGVAGAGPAQAPGSPFPETRRKQEQGGQTGLVGPGEGVFFNPEVSLRTRRVWVTGQHGGSESPQLPATGELSLPQASVSPSME